MRNRFLKITGGIALSILLFTLFGTEKVRSQQNGGGRLEGTWDVQLTVRNCQTGAELRSFPELTTFMFGGTMLDSTAGVPQALKTPGHGVWNHLNGDTYRFSFKAFTFNAAGTFVGWTKVTHEASLNSNATEYSSAGTAEVYDASGNLILTGCSTSTATRFE